jgi:transposase
MTARPTTALHETLLLALDLGNTTWKLACRVGGPAQLPRSRTTPARDLPARAREIAAAKRRFGLAADAPVISCFEAGRDGFWLHRALLTMGVTSLVVDSCSIERTARGRQPKSDRLDTTALLEKLGRHVQGERKVWSMVHVPSVADEDRRHLHRELTTLTWERTRFVNRIKGLLALHGVVLARRGLPRHLPSELRTGTAARYRERSPRGCSANGGGSCSFAGRYWRSGASVARDWPRTIPPIPHSRSCES